MMTQHELERIAPAQAVDLYLAQKEEDAADRTVQAHKYRLDKFIEWCEQKEITNLNELSGRLLYEYRNWRKNDGDLNAVSLRTQLCTIRTFLRFCESIDAVRSDLHDEILLPTLDTNQDAREEMLEPDRAEEVRKYLETFEYASTEHVIFEVFWSTSARLGAVQSLDVDDFDAEEQSLAFRHRPEQDTSLKNKELGERIVALPDITVKTIRDYVETTRPDVIDDNGRSPLIATENGRMSQSNIRSLVYSMTRPCQYADDCKCEDQYPYSRASRCEWSRSPHTLRRGSLTNLLKCEVPKQVVSDRADVSADVLDKHYNQLSQKEKMEQRKEYLGNI